MKLKLTKREQQRFLDKIKVNPETNCWEWQACKSGGGYGKFGFRGKTVLSHRLAYQCIIGEIPEGMELDHVRINQTPELCSRACCNPEHLEAVTHQQNMSRSKINIETSRYYGRFSGLSARKNDLPEGVTPNHKRFDARIHDPGYKKTVPLGTYTTPELASRAYREARVRINMNLPAKGTYMVGKRGNK